MSCLILRSRRLKYTKMLTAWRHLVISDGSITQRSNIFLSDINFLNEFLKIAFV